MELQQSLKALSEAGIQVVAISYDSPEILKRFAKKAEITFPLLSDPKSEAIRAYGIENEEMADHKKLGGVPHPGTFVVDGKGVLLKKLGRDGYRKRHSSMELLETMKAHKDN